MNGTILLYNIRDFGKRGLIQGALGALGVRLLYVDRKDYLKPLGALAGEKMFFAVDREYEGAELDDMMIVMAGLNGGQVDEVLKALRESGAGRLPYKAVLTETNKFWTSLMLFEELKKEHEAVSAAYDSKSGN